jgi:hypothetical protein
MRQLRIFGLALAGVLVLCAVTVSPALAEETNLLAQWLINGTPNTMERGFTDPGEFIFGEKSKQKVKCSYTTVGALGIDGAAEVTGILSLSGLVVNLTSPLSCGSAVGCEAAHPILVAPENFPWKIIIYLQAAGKFMEKVEKETWHIECQLFGFTVAIECTFESTEFELLNVVGGVEVMGNSAQFGTCSGNPTTFEMEQVPESGDENVTGLGLTVSSE